jgi:hypothetical protein
VYLEENTKGTVLLSTAVKFLSQDAELLKSKFVAGIYDGVILMEVRVKGITDTNKIRMPIYAFL